MREIEKRTNGDRVQPVIDGVKKAVRELAAYIREHPDELAIAALPVLALTWATRRHRLSALEGAVVAEVSYWCSVSLVREYRAWKARPAGPLPKLRKVI